MKELKGCGMRSSVGFLSRRELTGQPLMKEEFQRRRLAGCTSLYKKDMLGHFGCVNAIEFSNNGGEWLVSGKLTNPSSPRLHCFNLLACYVLTSQPVSCCCYSSHVCLLA